MDFGNLIEIDKILVMDSLPNLNPEKTGNQNIPVMRKEVKSVMKKSPSRHDCT